MATYKAKPINIAKSADFIADQFADLTRLQSALDNLPEEEKAKVGDVKFTTDAIVMQTPQVGEIKFVVKERSPRRVAFEAGGLPMPVVMAVDLNPQTSESTEATATLDIEIPAMLKPMVGGTMQKAVDKFSELISRLAK
ncbi:MAG: hypothetical protein K2M12_09130 [Muribaculaceae bacterium]|nr:hypothetical protein [Muribaculaceae bacterium]